MNFNAFILKILTDRAEQVASVVPRHIGPSTIPASQNLIPKTYNLPTTSSAIFANEDLNVIPPPEKHKEERPNIEEPSSRIEKERMNDNLSSFRKTELKLDNVDSVNHFYTHGRLNDSKVQLKQCVESQSLEPEPVSIIHNDISQKLLQKKLNDNCNTKIQNSYDMKLNQPSIKPSVSNVFSSLNEYINAPSASLLPEENSTECEPIDKKRRDEPVVKIESTSDCTVIKNITTDTGSISVIKNDIGTANTVPKLLNAVSLPPKYQNILLPIKLDSCVIEKPSNVTIAEYKAPEIVALPETSKATNIDRCLKAQSDKSERQEVKSIIDGPEHVYENVYIGTDIPKTQEIYAIVNKVMTSEQKETESKVEAEVKHTYENVDFGAKKVLQTDKDPVYECIYIGGRENLPETTTELEVAAKKMDQFYTNKKSQEPETKGSNTTRLVFQAVQLNAPPAEHKPIGFGNIDDLSEEELNRYLAELEAEERANEAAASEPTVQKFQNKPDDEDANEAPIFESVIIGELPSVSEEDLQQKAKKFPVIDYSNKSRVSGEGSSDFLAKKGSEKFHEPTKPISKAKEDKGRVKKSKKTNEKVRKCSDNMDLGQQSISKNDEERITEEGIALDKENGNCISESDSILKESSESLSQKSIAEETDVQDNKNSESNSSQDLNLEVGEETVDKLTNLDSSLDNADNGSKLNTNENMNRLRDDNNETRKIGDVNYSINHNEDSEEDLDRPSRPQTLDIVSTVDMTEYSTGN